MTALFGRWIERYITPDGRLYLPPVVLIPDYPPDAAKQLPTGESVK